MARVSFWSKKYSRYLEFTLIVDTGADYTLFPYSKANDLGISLEKECRVFKTFGIGGAENVFLLPRIKMELGKTVIFVPVGFLNRDNLPPLLGRYKCLDRFDLLFSSFTTTFST